MSVDFPTTVLRNVDLGGGDRLVEFAAPGEVLRSMGPGQFFMIGIPGAEVLLRRPFSVCGLPGTFADGASGAVQVLYRVYGRATSLMASLAAGAPIRVLGPLGRGFDPPEDRDALPVFVAGGIGSAPFPCFAASLARAGFRRPAMIYGARTSADLPLLEWFREHCDVRVTTEDGSLGARGRVTVALEDVLAAEGRRVHVYACGPSAMLKAVSRRAVDDGIRCDLALEAPMACGFGVCLGCVLPVHGDAPGEVRFERCCVEGPVMRAERLAW